MKSTIVASFLAFSLFFAPVTAMAASGPSTGDSRYFVQSTKSFWRNALGVRNVFDTGFTADLSDLQFKLAKLAGLRPIPVKKFNILAAAAPVAVPSSSPTPVDAPAKPVPWGVRYILQAEDPNVPVGGKDLTVAVLDTGVDRKHPDLKERVTKCTDYADLSKAFIDEECADANGHGTHMAGIVAADGGPDAKGIWGLAPQASLGVYKVCNSDGLCLSDDIAKAITAAVNDGANIIVLGMGGEADSSFIDDALAYAADHDVLVVAAAGNDGPYDDSMDWPARNPSVISVGATVNDGSVAQFSSRGNNEKTKPYQPNSGDLEFVAPGVNIESTFKDGGYAILSGTSMAAPHVAALAARVWQRDAKHPAAATRQVLHDMAKDILPAGDDNASGWGTPTY